MRDCTGCAPHQSLAARVACIFICGMLPGGLISQTTGPIVAYGFNEGTGTTATDQSGNSIAGTLQNTTWTNGKYSGGLSFNGSSSYVDLGNAALLQSTGSMTWSAWIQPKSNGQIIAK